MTKQLIELQGTIFLYIFFGLFLAKIGIFNEKAKNFISILITHYLLPINLFYSCITSFTRDQITTSYYLFALGIVSEAIAAIFILCKFRFFDEEKKKVFNYILLVSNCGLIGTPVIEGLFGSHGVALAVVYLIPLRVLSYAAGESFFNPKKRIRNVKDALHSLVTNVAVMGTLAGILIAYLGIGFPNFITSAMKGLSGCMTPLCLMVVGYLLNEQMKEKLTIGLDVVVVTLFRLIILPLLCLAVCFFLPLDIEAVSIIVLMMGMPAPANSAIYPSLYEGDYKFAVKSVFVSTICSSFTLVGLMWVVEKVMLLK